LSVSVGGAKDDPRLARTDRMPKTARQKTQPEQIYGLWKKS
jgi:hypothetical protein